MTIELPVMAVTPLSINTDGYDEAMDGSFKLDNGLW
jgi:hypothetical protein